MNSQQSGASLLFPDKSEKWWFSLILITESGGSGAWARAKVSQGSLGWGQARSQPSLSALPPAPFNSLPSSLASKRIHFLFYFFPLFLASKVFCLNGFVLRYKVDHSAHFPLLRAESHE